MDPNLVIAVLTFLVPTVSYLANRKRERTKRQQLLWDNIRSKIHEFENKLLKPAEADFLWLGQRALLGLAVAAKMKQEIGPLDPTLDRLLKREKRALLTSDFLSACEYGLNSAKNPRSKYRYLWPLAEFLEEIVDLYLITKKDVVFHEVVEHLLNPVNGGSLDTDRIWIISRACQEIQERNRSDKKKLRAVASIRKLVNKVGDDRALAIIDYCMQAERFENVGSDNSDINFENLLMAVLQFPTSLTERTSEFAWMKRHLEGWERFEDGNIRSITEWIDETLAQLTDVTQRWTTVSFLRLALQRIKSSALEEVGVHLLKSIWGEGKNWPLFLLFEIFEPVFFDLVFEKHNNTVMLRHNDYVKELKAKLVEGVRATKGAEDEIEFAYGVTTCLAELAEKGLFGDDKCIAVHLFDKELLANAPSESVRRMLLVEWLRCRVDRYPTGLGFC